MQDGKPPRIQSCFNGRTAHWLGGTKTHDYHPPSQAKYANRATMGPQGAIIVDNNVQDEIETSRQVARYANSVCGHGATAGALDPGLKFYLMSRGIDDKQAEALLIQAFIGETIEEVTHEGFRDALMAASLQWLETRV